MVVERRKLAPFMNTVADKMTLLPFKCDTTLEVRLRDSGFDGLLWIHFERVEE